MLISSLSTAFQRTAGRTDTFCFPRKFQRPGERSLPRSSLTHPPPSSSACLATKVARPAQFRGTSATRDSHIYHRLSGYLWQLATSLLNASQFQLSGPRAPKLATPEPSSVTRPGKHAGKSSSGLSKPGLPRFVFLTLSFPHTRAPLPIIHNLTAASRPVPPLTPRPRPAVLLTPSVFFTLGPVMGCPPVFAGIPNIHRVRAGRVREGRGGEKGSAFFADGSRGPPTVALKS
jgi:hypothetical protein